MVEEPFAGVADQERVGRVALPTRTPRREREEAAAAPRLGEDRRGELPDARPDAHAASAARTKTARVSSSGLRCPSSARRRGLLRSPRRREAPRFVRIVLVGRIARDPFRETPEARARRSPGAAEVHVPQQVVVRERCRRSPASPGDRRTENPIVHPQLHGAGAGDRENPQALHLRKPSISSADSRSPRQAPRKGASSGRRPRRPSGPRAR
jgi:hypothetical protein